MKKMKTAKQHNAELTGDIEVFRFFPAHIEPVASPTDGCFVKLPDHEKAIQAERIRTLAEVYPYIKDSATISQELLDEAKVCFEMVKMGEI